MKKLTALLLICSLCSFCFLPVFADIDLKSMTDLELMTLIQDARNELNSREQADYSSETVAVHGGDAILDWNGITFMMTGNLRDIGWVGPELESELINNSEDTVQIKMEDIYVNGQKVSGFKCFLDADPGKSAKDWLNFSLENTDIESVDDIKTISFRLAVYLNKWYIDPAYKTGELLITLQ